MRAYGERHGDAWLEGDIVRWARGGRGPTRSVRRVLKRRARREGVAATVLPIEWEPFNACDGFGYCCPWCARDNDDDTAWCAPLSTAACAISPGALHLVADAAERAKTIRALVACVGTK